jgi:hypothetical protein
MKQLTEYVRVNATNAWGRPSTHMEAVFEIEASDVGVTRDHYLGHNHRSVVFSYGDVGRQIVNMRDGTGWTCWSFK